MAGQQSITNINAIAVARGTSSPSNTEVLWLKPSTNPKGYEDLQIYDGTNWILVSRTPAQLLSDLKTVDGIGSGLDSDTLQGYTPAQLIASQSIPALSVGELLVGQSDTVGAAKTVSGVVTVSATGAFVYVANSISHTGLTDIGTNTHAQIDSHISDSAIHVSTAQATKLSNITVTQAVDLDQMEIDVTANTAKVGITSGQASEITANTAKAGITSGQASEITANTAKVGITSGQASEITANTAKAGVTSGQASEITANTAKVGITSGQASEITANTAKVGITSGQASEITANTAKVGVTSGQASEITANTAKVTNATHTGEVTGSGALTISDDIVDEANLKVSNTPTNGYVLTAQSGNAGGLTWAEAAGGDNIANTELTLPSYRKFNLGDFVFDIRPDSTNKRFEFLRSGNNPVLDFFDAFSTKVISLGRDSAGNTGNYFYVNNKLEVGTSNAIKLQNAGGNGSYLKFSNGFNDPYTQIGALIPHYFLAASGALNTNKFLVGLSSAIGSEKIGFYNDTLIKGSDNSASTSGFKVTDVNNNSLLDVKNNGSLKLQYLPSLSAGVAAGDVWSQNGTLRIGNCNSKYSNGCNCNNINCKYRCSKISCNFSLSKCINNSSTNWYTY